MSSNNCQIAKTPAEILNSIFQAKNWYKLYRTRPVTGEVDLSLDSYGAYRELYCNRAGLYNFYFDNDTSVSNSVAMNLSPGEVFARPTLIEQYIPVSGVYSTTGTDAVYTFTVTNNANYDIALCLIDVVSGNITITGATPSGTTKGADGFLKMRLATTATTLVVTVEVATELLNYGNNSAISCNRALFPFPGDFVVIR